MFYEPGKTDHGLPFDPFKACVVPRPIGWISTVSLPIADTAETIDNHNTVDSSSSRPKTGPTEAKSEDKSSRPLTRLANLAPYSQFQNLTFDPPYVMFSANQTPDNTQKDTARNAEQTGVFCWQLATYSLRSAVNITSEQFPSDVDEFSRAGLTKTYSRTLPISVPMVAESPIKFECTYHSTIRLPGNPPMGSVDIIIGKVVAVHIDDDVLTNGKIDVSKTMPIARCGYYEYAVIKETFEMAMPGTQIMRAGLEGSAKKNREEYDRISSA